MRKRFKSSDLSTPAIYAVTFLICGCVLEEARENTKEYVHSQAVLSAPSSTNQANQTNQATAVKGLISVHLTGQAVRRGWYRFPNGTTVRDAMNVALKKGAFADWRLPYSCIYRGSDTIWFSYANRTTDEQIRLRDGDELYLSHESY